MLVDVAALCCGVGATGEDGGGRGGGDGGALVPRAVPLGCSLVQLPAEVSRCAPVLDAERLGGPPPPCAAARCHRGVLQT